MSQANYEVPVKAFKEKQKEADQLRDKNKLLADALRSVIKYALQSHDGECSIQKLEGEIEMAKDVLEGNAIILIEFPDYLKKHFTKDDVMTVKEVIETYNQWNQ